ncbi:hypothetical protein V6Z11_A08G001000 [Gossypium hirsutum]
MLRNKKTLSFLSVDPVSRRVRILPMDFLPFVDPVSNQVSTHFTYGRARKGFCTLFGGWDQNLGTQMHLFSN